MKRNVNLLKMVLAAFFLALAYVMPFLTGQIPKIGAMLCPMHVPILLCGFICGPIWGAAVGFVAPLLRSITLGVPLIFPMAVCMAFELMTYGAIAGLMHKLLPSKKPYIYCSLIAAMMLGRIVFGIAMFTCVTLGGGGYTFAAFIASAITNSILGIVIQIVLVPILVILIENSRFFRERE
jgi:thiamine transporter ThiT